MDVIALDKELFLWLNNLGNPTWDAFWMAITNKLTWIPFYVLIAYLIYRKYNLRMLFITLGISALMIICTDQVSHLFKDILIQRLRPCGDPEVLPYMRLVKSYCGGKFGFFSGHATNHFAVAVLVGAIFKYKWWVLPILLIWASLIAYSRIYIGVHFPLDVITGGFVGSLFGLYAFQVWRYFRKRQISAGLLRD